MSALGRRSFLLRTGGTGLGLAMSGALAPLTAVASPAGPGAAARRIRGAGYGALVPDPAGLLDLPPGFRYRALSRAGVDVLDDGRPVPAEHDGMAAFRGPWPGSTVLVRNHEVDPEAVEEEGAIPVPHVPGRTYDPNGTGGTTTLVVGPDRRLLSHQVSLAGTHTNCAGGPTPWGTWLTCEETDEVLEGIRHGYVFEVDPSRGGDVRPITAMGRFEHEAVGFAADGTAYLTEDADGPHGQLYRFRPRRPGGGRGSLHAGGELSTLLVPELAGTDLSAVTEVGTTFDELRWLPVTVPDPGPDDGTVRELHPATPIPKCEGIWAAGGRLWFVSSRGDGPDAEDEDERSDGVHGGQIWSYDPRRSRLRLEVRFAQDDLFEGPDNITFSPHGYALVCTDGEDADQFLAGITPDGRTFPLAYNRLSEDELAGVCVSPDGRTLFVNVQVPGHTFAIWGPW